jgi:hypothetical protein
MNSFSQIQNSGILKDVSETKPVQEALKKRREALYKTKADKEKDDV